MNTYGCAVLLFLFWAVCVGAQDASAPEKTIRMLLHANRYALVVQDGTMSGRVRRSSQA